MLSFVRGVVRGEPRALRETTPTVLIATQDEKSRRRPTDFWTDPLRVA